MLNTIFNDSANTFQHPFFSHDVINIKGSKFSFIIHIIHLHNSCTLCHRPYRSGCISARHNEGTLSDIQGIHYRRSGIPVSPW
ncbi:putative [Escherichia phage Mu]|uniref:Bacteriophage Mu left end n=1 Tax=Escherichia phage Mu TaxID=2681603 RepID=Q38491_BPMU|nr:putative [Escherichia phage Mu]